MHKSKLKEQKTSRTLVQINSTSLSEKENEIPEPSADPIILFDVIRRALWRPSRAAFEISADRSATLYKINRCHTPVNESGTHTVHADARAHPDVKISLGFRSGHPVGHNYHPYQNRLIYLLMDHYCSQ